MKTATMTTALPLTLLALAVATTGCSRADTSREAREVAADVRTAAARAGDRLADSWLTAKVQAKFFADEDIKVRYIDVSSRDGMVTLEGFVENDTVRHEAVQIARNTEGVTQVDDRLLIGQAPQTASSAAPLGSTGTETIGTTGSASVPDDSMVTSLIQSKYFVDPALKVRSIDVSTTGGIVTLRGSVASDNERAQALLLARTTSGVQRVEDALSVDAALAPASGALGLPSGSGALPSAPVAGAGRAVPSTAAQPSGASGAVGTSGTVATDASLENALRSQLAGDAQLKAAGLDVSARDGVVLLQGTVGTQAMKQRALTLAGEHEGVMQVIDRITVKPR